MRRLEFTTLVITLLLTLLTSCGKDDDSSSNNMMMHAGESHAGESHAGESHAGESMAGDLCTAQVEIGFFTDPECTQPVMANESTRVYDTTQDCFSWEGSSAAGENSATRFQCFRDRICYTQHPATLACDNPTPTNKEARTDECVLDTQTPDGSRSIYAKIIGGTENCPIAPDGYECPVSEIRGGTPGIAACTMEP